MMADEPRIEPPEGSNWQAQSPCGLQRFKSGPDGRVVRLTDVVRWLMQARELPLAEAVQAVCAPLESDAPPLVYELDVTDWARAEFTPIERQLFEKDLMGVEPYVALARVIARNARHAWLMNPRDLARLVNAPGYPIEYDSATETPFEFTARPDGTGGPFTAAVPFAVAHELWGWGTIAAPVAAPVSAPSAAVLTLVRDDASPTPALAAKVPMKAQAPDWTGEKLAQKRKTLKGRNTTEQLSKITGLPAREITRREKAWRDEVQTAQAGKSQAA